MSQGPRRVAAVLALALVAAAPQPKDAKLAEPKAQDTTLFHTLKEIINRGADLYNSGDPAACYRLFEGSLTTVRPLLDHRPELQKSITRGLASAERDPLTWRRAFTLRSVLDKVRGELNPARGKDADKLGPPKAEDDKKPEPKKDDKKDDKQDD